MHAPIELTDKQQECVEALFTGKYTQLLYGGAMAGGKTYLLCCILFMLCKIYPGSRWAVVRKDLPALKRNLLPTYYEVAPDGFVAPINKSEWTAKCANGSEIIFFTANTEKDPDLNRWRGLEVSGFLADEVNEIPYEAYVKMMERAGRWNPAGMVNRPPPLIFMTCNPSRNWVKTTFYDKWKTDTLGEDQFYLPAYATDNIENIPKETRENWERMKISNPKWYEQFVLGNWDLHADDDQLLQVEWVDAAWQRPSLANYGGGHHYLGVDVARYGDDETVLAHRIGSHLHDLECYSKLDNLEVATKVREKIDEYNINPTRVVIDTIGVGSGVYDILKGWGYLCSDFIAGASPTNDNTDTIRFRNQRAQQWWGLRNRFREGRISLNPQIRKEDKIKLNNELNSVKYQIDSDKTVQIESKDFIKKRIGKSIDCGDAVMQAFADISNIDWLVGMNAW